MPGIATRRASVEFVRDPDEDPLHPVVQVMEDGASRPHGVQIGSARRIGNGLAELRQSPEFVLDFRAEERRDAAAVRPGALPSC